MLTRLGIFLMWLLHFLPLPLLAKVAMRWACCCIVWQVNAVCPTTNCACAFPLCPSWLAQCLCGRISGFRAQLSGTRRVVVITARIQRLVRVVGTNICKQLRISR